MAKTITNNVRNNEQMAIMHLFEFDIYNLDGIFDETLRFTDHDLFVTYQGNEFTPLQITFDTLIENSTLSADNINISIDNVSGAMTEVALGKEWRNNPARIIRVLYTPPEETVFDETYEFGIGNNLGNETYPQIDLSTYNEDSYILFEGIIDTFNTTERALSGNLTSLFVNWQKPDPIRTYNQQEFTTIIEAVTDLIYWGRAKDV